MHALRCCVRMMGTPSSSRPDTSDISSGTGRRRDTWVWYGWTIWAGERQRWFVYATFGHSAASLITPWFRRRTSGTTFSNVTPHAQFLGNALYEYLPLLSRGTGAPQPTARLEFTTVELVPGAERAFEAAIGAGQAKLEGETLWFRMVAGGTAPRYVRLRPRPSLSALLVEHVHALPDKVDGLIAKTTVEILTLRPTMSYGLSAAP